MSEKPAEVIKMTIDFAKGLDKVSYKSVSLFLSMTNVRRYYAVPTHGGTVRVGCPGK